MSNALRQSDGRFLSRLFFRVLPAQIILLMLTGINNIIDGLVGSNFFGPGATGVIGLYAPFQMIWVAIGNVVMVGSQVLCARYMGAGDLPKTQGVFSLNLTVIAGVIAIGSLLSFTLSSPIAAILGASQALSVDLASYIIGRGMGLVPMILAAQFVAFLSLEGKDKLNFISTGAMVVVNIALDLLFATTFHEIGVMGLGIATSLSQWVYAITAGAYFATKKSSLKYSVRNICWKELREMLKVGFPSALTLFLISIRSSMFNNLLGAFDPTMISVAALSSFTMSIMVFESAGKGVASTGRILSSLYYGEEDGRSLTAVVKTLFTKGILIVLISCAASLLLAEPVAGLFYPDPTSEVHRLTAMTMRFGAVYLFLQAIGYIFHDYFQAIGRTFIVNLMSILEGIGFMLPLGLLLIPRMGLEGVMLSFIVGFALLALVGPVFAIIYWKRMPRNLREWLTIPADFGAADDERMDASIHSLEDAVAVAQEVRSFCRERNIDEKRAYYSALVVEELSLGIIKERFGTDSKRKHTIEVRVVDKGEDLLLSLKDDCKPFNPQERADLVNPQDSSEKSISIRLFMGIAKTKDYQLSLGINVFTVTV